MDINQLPSDLSDQQAALDRVVAMGSSCPPEASGRGIVLCAGGEYLTGAWVIVSVLRRLFNCLLPIEIWHLGDGELTGVDAKIKETYKGITFRDAVQESRETGDYTPSGGWQLKPFAIAHSRFEEVLFIDADNLPLRDDINMAFNWPQYRHHGCVFWPSFGRIPPGNPIWEVCRVPYRDIVSFESGQILIDKRKCWPALMATCHMNRNSYFYYNYCYGDKDTFQMSWLRTDKSYALIPHMPVRYAHKAQLQYDFQDRVLFQHRFEAKWKLKDNPLLGKHPVEAIAHSFIGELS